MKDQLQLSFFHKKMLFPVSHLENYNRYIFVSINGFIRKIKVLNLLMKYLFVYSLDTKMYG